MRKMEVVVNSLTVGSGKERERHTLKAPNVPVKMARSITLYGKGQAGLGGEERKYDEDWSSTKTENKFLRLKLNLFFISRHA